MVKEVFDEHRLPDDFAHKLIHGLEKERWGAGQRENSTIGALAAALHAMGEDEGYEFLMGVSGAAFRLQMHKPGWCPSGPHARCGFDCLEPVMDALPFEMVDTPVQKDDASAIEGLRGAIVDSIDRGVPVFYSSLEESLIVGYQEGGKRLLLRLYGADSEGYAPWSLERPAGESGEEYPGSFVGDWPHLSFGFLKRKAERPDRRESIVRSLELATKFAHTEQVALYASGVAAYEFWVEGLRDESRFVDEAYREHALAANAVCYYGLYDARSAAAAYLREVAGEFEGEAATHLARAADLYRTIAEDVLARRCVTEIAPMRWRLGKDGAWTREMRYEQADLLDEALGLERQAIGEIEAALAAL
ncbi:MAG: hypothetical protein V3V67_00190 [Myxococcota bacterium]